MSKHKSSTKKPKKGGGKIMIMRNMRWPEELYNEAMTKAGITPLSAIVRRLVEMWLDGEIKIK